jgi:outer membrane protein W
MAMRRLVLLVAGCSLAVAVESSANSVNAQETQTTTTTTTTDFWRFKIYGGPAYVAPLDDSDVSFETVTDSLQAQDHVGWNLGVEARFNQLLGLELDYVNAHQDVDFGGVTIGETTFSPLTLTANLHLIPSKVVDFYVGPSFTYVNWGDIELSTSGIDIVPSGVDVGLDSETGWGLSTGIDFGLGKNFAVGAGLKWLNVDMTLGDGQSSDVEPLVARLTAAFRF